MSTSMTKQFIPGDGILWDVMSADISIYREDAKVERYTQDVSSSTNPDVNIANGSKGCNGFLVATSGTELTRVRETTFASGYS